MSEEKEVQQIPESAEGKSQTPTAQEKSGDATEERIKKINDAADRLEQAERKLAERENSLREAEALGRLGGRTNAGDPKLTPEEEKNAIAQKEADSIVKAFR